MQIKKVNGHNVVCNHMFSLNEIETGTHWTTINDSDRTVEVDEVLGDRVYYSDGELTYSKDWLSFQCRYCKIVEDICSD